MQFRANLDPSTYTLDDAMERLHENVDQNLKETAEADLSPRPLNERIPEGINNTRS